MVLKIGYVTCPRTVGLGNMTLVFERSISRGRLPYAESLETLHICEQQRCESAALVLQLGKQV